MGEERPRAGNGSSGPLGRLWGAVKQRGLCFTLAVLVVGGIGGILFWGGFNWALELTNTESFCISCHEMEATPYKELKETIHYTGTTGVRAICSDCHVPKQWIYKVVRKIKATRELYYHLIGEIDTPEKFEEQRLKMAKRVWATMKANDSRECRNCHSIESMDFAKQTQRARTQHEDSLTTGETCIDCHKGIAHKDVSKLEKEAAPADESFEIQ